MNRFAVVDDKGVVTNLIAYDGVSETSYNPPPVPLGEQLVAVGDCYLDGVFYIRPCDGFEYEFTAGEGWKITAAGQAAKDAAIIEDAEREKTARLAYASQVTADWRTDLALGIISDDDEAKLKEWMLYIKAVKAVDASKAPDIEWPTQPVSLAS